MHFLFILPMAYSIQGHISYILEANSKRPIREKKKINRKRSKLFKEIEWADLFSLRPKIFHIQFSSLCFQINSNERSCLHSMPKVIIKTKRKMIILCKEECYK